MRTVAIEKSLLEGRINLIEISGSLDAHNFEQLEEVFDALFDCGGYDVIVDISRVDYMSSAGVGVLIGAAGRAQANEGTIVVVGPQESVREVFDLLGIGHIFPVVDTREKAFAHFTTTSR
jgi:anti-anti-sigma factor